MSKNNTEYLFEKLLDLDLIKQTKNQESKPLADDIFRPRKFMFAKEKIHNEIPSSYLKFEYLQSIYTNCLLLRICICVY